MHPPAKNPVPKPQVTLRSYETCDLDALHALDVECFEVPFRFPRAELKAFAEDPRALVRIAEVAGEIAGFVIVHLSASEEGRFGYVVTLDVKREHRRAGVAVRLMEDAERLSLGRGATFMKLHVFFGNVGARRVYHRLGYEERGRATGFYGEGRDALLMQKRLPVGGEKPAEV